MEIETGEYQVYVALNANEILDYSNVTINGVEFEKIEKPKELEIKAIEFSNWINV